MKETASAVGATISGAYSAFLGGMAIKLAIEGIRRSFATSNVPSSDLEASNPGYDADQSSSASETGATPKRVNNPKPRNRRRCPCPCSCPDRSKKDDKTHRRNEPKIYKPTKTTQLWVVLSETQSMSICSSTIMSSFYLVSWLCIGLCIMYYDYQRVNDSFWAQIECLVRYFG